MTDFSRFDRFKARRQTKQQRPAAVQAVDDSSSTVTDAPQQRLTGNTSSAARASQPPALLQRRGQQQQRVDQQIWHLHARMVDKLLAEPQLFAPLPEKLEQAQQQGLLRHSEYLFWHCAFALYPDAAAFRSAILSQQPGPCKYRRRTRLVGILTETERAEILQQQAMQHDPT